MCCSDSLQASSARMSILPGGSSLITTTASRKSMLPVPTQDARPSLGPALG